MVPKGIHGCECLEWRQVGGPEQGASDAAVTVSEVAKHNRIVFVSGVECRSLSFSLSYWETKICPRICLRQSML